jgi:hypothetical protein
MTSMTSLNAIEFIEKGRGGKIILFPDQGAPAEGGIERSEGNK